MCCELQSGLDGFECPAVIWEGRHFKFHGSLDRELEPVVLMNVVEPGADDKSIHHLRKLLHHITSSALTFIWERECSENICRRGLPQHLSNHSVGVIGYFSEAVISVIEITSQYLAKLPFYSIQPSFNRSFCCAIFSCDLCCALTVIILPVKQCFVRRLQGI